MGRCFSVETPDRRNLVATVVVSANGYYKVDLAPGNYFIDTGDKELMPGYVQVPSLQYLRMDLVLR